VAYRVASESGDSVLAYLRKRELVTNVYLEVRRPVLLQRPTPVVTEALLYVVDRRHPQYAGNLNPAEALAIVEASHGPSGPNPEYVINTADHLRGMGIRDAGLEWLARQLRAGADGGR
jgi:cation transport protein ChaC